MNPELLIGGPGTGKTHTLIETIEAAGVPTQRCAFVSFTRAAALEAQTRTARDLGRTLTQLPHFRTLHSMCFRELGLRRGDVLAGESMRELERLTGESWHRMEDGDAGPWEVADLARITNTDPEHRALEYGVDLHRFRRAVKARARYKKDKGLLDFTDMLEQYADHGDPLDVDLAIIDEAQDLTPLQWRVVHRAFGNTPRVIIAGDDDQAIHEWAGATLRPFLEHRGPKTELSLSHRLPKRVHNLSLEVLNYISPRINKHTQASDKVGEVEWYSDPEQVPIQELSGSWLLLARARYQLEELEAIARGAGIPYMIHGKSSINEELLAAAREYEATVKPEDPRWHDALTQFSLLDREYLLACRRAGEKLNERPRVEIDTVHGAKGRQADHVLLLTDLTRKIMLNADLNEAAEYRVLYVGVTRASQSLHLVQPRGPYAWKF